MESSKTSHSGIRGVLSGHPMFRYAAFASVLSAIAMIAFLGLMLPQTNAVEAQSNTELLVGNAGETNSLRTALQWGSYAQSFTTGATPVGYQLDDITLTMSQSAPGGTPGTIIASLHEASANGTKVADFSSVTNSTNLQKLVPVQDVTLKPNTTYHMVVQQSALLLWSATAASDEAGAAGWSMGDNRQLDNGSGFENEAGPFPGPFQMAVNGTDAEIEVVNVFASTSSSSLQLPTSGYHALGNPVYIHARFNHEVEALSSDKKIQPTFDFQLGDETRQAIATRFSGTDVVFEYPLQADDPEDFDGISWEADAITAFGPAGIVHRATVDGTQVVYVADVSHAPKGPLAAHKVGQPPTAPVITSMRIVGEPQANDYYEDDALVRFRVTFDRRIEVNGYPAFSFKIGDQTRTASFEGVSRDHTKMRFLGGVFVGDTDHYGMSWDAGAITLISDGAIYLKNSDPRMNAVLDYDATRPYAPTQSGAEQHRRQERRTFIDARSRWHVPSERHHRSQGDVQRSGQLHRHRRNGIRSASWRQRRRRNRKQSCNRQ